MDQSYQTWIGHLMNGTQSAAEQAAREQLQNLARKMSDEELKKKEFSRTQLFVGPISLSCLDLAKILFAGKCKFQLFNLLLRQCTHNQLIQR